jgi:hypothetical protein
VARGPEYLAGAAFGALLVAALGGSACSATGDGTGCATGSLNISNCWAGDFNLHPNFFGAIPASSAGSLLIRVQNGSDFESFSDGIAFEIDDIGTIRGDPLSDGTPQESLLCPCSASDALCPGPDGGGTGCAACAPGSPTAHRLIVSLPPGVTAPGVPVEATADPSIVHATLYLQHSCRTQDLALYALSAVSLNPDGSCVPPVGSPSVSLCGGPAILATDGGASASVSLDGGANASVSLDGGANASVSLDGGATPPTGPPAIGVSTISFHALFDGNENESSAQQRLSYADFDLYFADPREGCPGGLGPPPPCRGHLTGNFNFYFERGQPAQPFP